MVITRESPFIAATMLTLLACSGGSSKARITDAGVDTPVDQKPIDFFSYLPALDGGPALACMGCFKSRCGTEINACANSVNCREGLLCAFGQCSMWSGALGGSMSSAISSADLACISTCFKGDLSAALLASQSASCTVTTCRESCAAALPGDGGVDSPLSADGAVPSGLDGSSSQDVAAPGAQDAAIDRTIDVTIDATEPQDLTRQWDSNEPIANRSSRN